MAPLVEGNGPHERRFELNEDDDIGFDDDDGGNWGKVENDEDVVGSADLVVPSNGEDSDNDAAVIRLSCDCVAVVVKERQAREDMADIDIILFLLLS